MNKIKVIRTATVAVSLNILLKGQLSFLNKFYNIIAVSGYNQFLEEVRVREKVTVHDIDIDRQISIIKDLLSLIKLVIFFYKEKPQIVHSITPKAGLLSMIAAKLTGVPIRIHTFTGLIFPSKKGLMKIILIKMDQLLCICATNIYPEGKGVENDLKLYNITDKPLKVLANGNVNGIDTFNFSPDQVSLGKKLVLKKHLGINDLDFVFIFVGRLVGDKGINELVPAFEKLSAESQTVKLLLVGPLEQELDPLSDSTLLILNTNKNIISVGYQSDVRSYFAISDVLVFPSFREGFPNVVMQAGAMGLPSIVSNINGCNEIIIDGKNGIIIPVKDMSAIYHAMKKIMKDNDFRNSVQANSRSSIVSRYEQQVVWDAILAEYKSLEKNV
jgi:glycosyltransferase involved in cell wall biosynthesis